MTITESYRGSGNENQRPRKGTQQAYGPGEQIRIAQPTSPLFNKLRVR